MGEDREVAVLIVTHNSARDLPECLAAIGAQTYRPLSVVVVDCASDDGVEAVLREGQGALQGVPLAFYPLGENRGFAGGMNAALERTAAPYVLSLNADARPEPEAVARLVARLEAPQPASTGAVTGRLVRPPEADGTVRLDACGMRLTRTWRHLDRGSGEVDEGQYSEPERVFGATGAATLFRRSALDDVAVGGEVFDADFHSFREDAELAFRLRERGWEILYEPAARIEHRRFNLPQRRRAMPAYVNYHSLKNRYLLRAYHQTAGNALRTLVPTGVRDLMALVYVLFLERSSLAAYRWLFAHRRRILERRRIIQGRRTVPPAAIDRWFQHSRFSL
jgi:GT2 family glycosyltransferase